MQVDDAIRSRRSVRSFLEASVDRQTIEEVLELAGLAPSSFNSQPWYFHVASGQTRERAAAVLAQTTRYVREYLDSLEPEQAQMAEEFFAELGYAPVFVAVSVPVTDSDSDNTNNLIAAGGAIQNLQLAARSRELGSCCITFSYWTRDDLAEVFDVPQDRSIVSIVILGHPAEIPPPPPRLPLAATFSE